MGLQRSRPAACNCAANVAKLTLWGFGAAHYHPPRQDAAPRGQRANASVNQNRSPAGVAIDETDAGVLAFGGR